MPNVRLQSYRIIAGGCANLNIGLNLNDGRIKLLRIYIRDHDAAYREQAICKLIGKSIPVPMINSIAEIKGFHFALCEFKSGITLRELLLSKHTYDINAIMYQVGEMLAKLQQFTFPISGFFNAQLKINEPIPDDGLIRFAKSCLQHDVVKTVLTESQINTLD